MSQSGVTVCMCMCVFWCLTSVSFGKPGLMCSNNRSKRVPYTYWNMHGAGSF